MKKYKPYSEMTREEYLAEDHEARLKDILENPRCTECQELATERYVIANDGNTMNGSFDNIGFDYRCEKHPRTYGVSDSHSISKPSR